MLHRIRLAMQTGGFGKMTKIGDGGDGEVEVDETFIGAKMKNDEADLNDDIRFMGCSPCFVAALITV
jgi:hypothetical protein